MSKKFKVGIIYGGESGEHEVSLVTAYWVIFHMDRSQYEPVPIGIDKSGAFWRGCVEDVVDHDERYANGDCATYFVSRRQ